MQNSQAKILSFKYLSKNRVFNKLFFKRKHDKINSNQCKSNSFWKCSWKVHTKIRLTETSKRPISINFPTTTKIQKNRYRTSILNIQCEITILPPHSMRERLRANMRGRPLYIRWAEKVGGRKGRRKGR